MAVCRATSDENSDSNANSEYLGNGGISDHRRGGLIPSYGRKRSHGLSEAQKLDMLTLSDLYGVVLSGSSVNDLSNFFSDSSFFQKIYVEIGFGGGEHLIQNAKQRSDVAFIGCEPFENGVVNALRGIRDNHLENVRIFQGDARLLLEKLSAEFVDRFYVLFPDPWPKQRYRKRRLISKSFLLDFIYPKLKKGGEIIIATDSEDYITSILKIFGEKELMNRFESSIGVIAEGKLEHSNCSGESGHLEMYLRKLQERPEWFVLTRYEQKALNKGVRPFYLSVVKTG